MNLNQEESEFESKSENAKMSSISLNTSINRKRISDNLRAKRATRTLFVVTKKRNNDDANDVFDVADDFNAASANEEIDDDDELEKSERDADEAFDVVNDDEVARRETNVDENFFRDVFRNRDNDNALKKRKRI
jgi:hypothetical protein